MTKSTQFKDKRRRMEYNIYDASHNMWKKADSISFFLTEGTRNTTFSPLFTENVRSFIGELNGLKRYNHNSLSRPSRNKCADSVIPRLKHIVRLCESKKYTEVRHQVSELRILTQKMCKRFSNNY